MSVRSTVGRAAPVGAAHRRSLIPPFARTGMGAVLYIALLLAAWEGVVRAFSLRSYILPGPIAVFEAGIGARGLLVRHGWITLYEALLGFGLSAVIGIALAIIMVYSAFLRRFILPTLVAINATPKVAVAPILIIWLGLGVPSKIALAFLLSFFPIVINTARGLDDVSPDLLAYFRLMQANSWNTFRKARLPNSLPSMFDGFKIALPIAMIGAVIGEFVAARAGIGYQIIVAYSNFNTELVFAAVIFIAVLSTLLFQALVWVESILLRWRPSASEL